MDPFHSLGMMKMSPEVKSLIRSCITTFLATLLAAVPVSALSGDVQWVGPAVLASLVAAVRTLLAYVDPGNASFGVTGSEKDAGADAGDEAL